MGRRRRRLLSQTDWSTAERGGRTRAIASFVSIVTPFHNTADFLAECIESVLAQTYDDFEYLLLDNASTDGSTEIARSYADKDARIRYLTTDRLLNQVENYNYALSLISPDSVYCKICQADDWIYPNCVAELVALAERAPSVVIVSSYSLEGRELMNVGLDVTETVIPGAEIVRRFFDGLLVFGSPTTLLYRADLIRRRVPFYASGRLDDDAELCFEVLPGADFGFVHQVLSYIRTQDDSITGRRQDLHTGPLKYLMYVEHYARSVMPHDEWQRRRRRARADYYEQLGRRVLRAAAVPTPELFWATHRDGLRSIGQDLSLPRLAAGTVIAAAKVALSPLDVAARLGELRRRRRE